MSSTMDRNARARLSEMKRVGFELTMKCQIQYSLTSHYLKRQLYYVVHTDRICKLLKM